MSSEPYKVEFCEQSKRHVVRDSKGVAVAAFHERMQAAQLCVDMKDAHAAGRASRDAEVEELRELARRAKLMSEAISSCPKITLPGGQTIQSCMGNTIYTRVPHSLMHVFLEAYFEYDMKHAEPLAKETP